jgi:hypothetical protein
MVGHLLECAGQLTGGYFADPGPKDVPGIAALGFPYADVDRDGNARFVERSFAPDGTLANEAAFEFEITTRATAPSPGAVSPLP